MIVVVAGATPLVQPYSLTVDAGSRSLCTYLCFLMTGVVVCHVQPCLVPAEAGSPRACIDLYFELAGSRGRRPDMHAVVAGAIVRAQSYLVLAEAGSPHPCSYLYF